VIGNKTRILFGGENMKPKYLIFYKNEENLEQLINRYPFNRQEDVLNKRKSNSEFIIEYDHYILQGFKVNNIYDSYRGHRAWGILIEECLYNLLGDNWIPEHIVHIFPTGFINKF